MSNKPKIYHYKTMRGLANRIRSDFSSGDMDFVLIYAYNSTGKTRLSMEFKEQGKRKNNGNPDTLYFNAFTEDLFSWDNDLADDNQRVLRLNSDSRFFTGIKELALEESIQSYWGRYTDLDFDINYTDWTISFSKGDDNHLKVSRGEENVFIWCLFMAVCERVIAEHPSYGWVKHIYIDDPISSLDDNNAIAVATDLATLLRKAHASRAERNRIKVAVSSHHALFFNVICNELKKLRHKKYFLHRPDRGSVLTLRATTDTPFFHHVAMLSEMEKAAQSGELYTYHFNILRSILEKTATFFGHNNFSACIHGIEDEGLYARALNLLSHGSYSLYDPREMVEDNKVLFRKILSEFLKKYEFDLPELFKEATALSGNPS